MRLGLVCYLVAHAGPEQELSAIFKFSIEFALEAKQDVAFGAPMVGQIPGCVFHHPYPNIPELPRAPISGSGDAFVLGGFDG
ncbi:hypothetical protein SAMN03159474_01559 [Pseudomonas sp. NFACC08-1]|nr:hypothetical protein SAMN03159474_01559 [Pseudomonas sp. NFACC08-1]